MMDDAVGRPTLVENVNSAFSAQNIAISAARLAGLSPRADFLAISRRVGVLRSMSDAQFARYRRRINEILPPPIRRILTIAHRIALYADPPIPLHIEINPVTPPSIQVTYTDRLISIVLNRPDPPPFEC
jgi:hypothetical protein